MFLNNRLIQPDSLSFCGETINLEEIDVPSMFIAARQDHIAKWKSCYTGAQAHGGKVKFLLGGSGHIAGIINPPYKEKYGFWTRNVDTLPENPDDWLAEAEQHPGSWWPHWVEWLAQYQGDQVSAGPGRRQAESVGRRPWQLRQSPRSGCSEKLTPECKMIHLKTAAKLMLRRGFLVLQSAL